MNDLHASVSHRLRQRQYNYTSGRRKLVSALAAAENPITLPEIISAAPDLKPSSVYRNLEIFESCGVVSRIRTTGDHSHFELAEPLLDHHHHLICVECGAIADIQLDAELEALVDKSLSAAAKKAKFSPLHHSLDLHGTCASCEPSGAKTAEQNG